MAMRCLDLHSKATTVAVMSTATHTNWWRSAVVYQIYPRSFQDSTGNGVGDLPGITKRLEYLSTTLGVDAIWISPMFPSPMADFGYDVADYIDVEPLFGTLDDADALIDTAHRLGLKVIIDWVPNHSSDQHAWFKASRTSLDDPKRDWYVWAEPDDQGGPPNNWLSLFGGPAWTLDDGTQQYYLHSFLAEQPDLNWRNPDVVDAMMDTLRFWLDRGVDGFRMDVAHFMAKDPLMRSNPPATDSMEGTKTLNEYDTQEHLYDKGHDEIFAMHARIRAVLDEYDNRFAVGEIHESDWQRWKKYYGKNGDGLHMPFNFSLLWASWEANDFRDKITAQESAIPPGAWGNHVLGNHDEPRFATRFGPERLRAAAVLLLTLKGTPTLYYGEELGLADCTVEPGCEQDPWGKNQPELNRDGCRSPMQWIDGPGMGFTLPGITPWLPFSDSNTNVADQLDDPASTLSLYQSLLELRHGTPALTTGSITMLEDSGDHVLSYSRNLADDTVYVAINFTDTPQNYEFPAAVTQMLGTAGHRFGTFETVVLESNEAIITR
jgi:alpha-glucosidase